MHENMQLIPFLNALEDQYNYPKVEMCNAGISVDAQRCALPKVTKADMRKAVVTSKAFRTAPGHLISVSDKHVRY